MPPTDLSQLDRHLAEVRDELAELHDALEEAAAFEREATLAEVHAALRPTLDLLVRVTAGVEETAEGLPALLTAALPQLGLERRHQAGEELDLFPEEAREDFALDREIPTEATLVRVKVLSSGWRRGLLLVTRPVGRVLEFANGK